MCEKTRVCEIHENLAQGVIEVKLYLVERSIRAYYEHLKSHDLDVELTGRGNVLSGVLVNITPIDANAPDPDFSEYDNAMTVIMGSWLKSDKLGLSRGVNK
jgi:hypothetical protein